MEVKYMWTLICKKGGQIQWEVLDAEVSGAIAWIKRLKVDARTWIFCQNKGK